VQHAGPIYGHRTLSLAAALKMISCMLDEEEIRNEEDEVES
jgi:hypothetical protein